MKIVKAACPKCKKHFNIEMNEPKKFCTYVLVSCDYCGYQKRISVFLRELKKQQQAPIKVKQEKKKVLLRKAVKKQQEKERVLLREEKQRFKQEDHDTRGLVREAFNEQQHRLRVEWERERNSFQVEQARRTPCVNPGTAAILTFIWGGLGYVYVGRIFSGMLFMFLIWPVLVTVVWLVCIPMILVHGITQSLSGVIIFLFVLLGAWAWIIRDSYKVAENYNLKLVIRSQPNTPSIVGEV